MDIKALIDNPLLSLVGNFVPQARAVVDFVRAHENIIVAAAPVVQAAASEGASAFAAAKAKAPGFAKAVTDLVKLLPAGAISAGRPDIHLENITRNLIGMHRMTAEEESALMDKMTPHGDPSQENSKFGG